MYRAIPVVLALLFPSVAMAHHGAGSFELTKTIQLQGKLTRIDFINPHSWLYFENTDANGKVVRYRCEMRSAHVLRRSGWSQDMFPIGKQISLEASPDRADPNSCYLQTIKFPDGSHMDRYGQYVKAKGTLTEVRGPIATPNTKREYRRSTGEPNLAGDWAPEQMVMANARGTGGGLVPLGSLSQPAPARGGGGGGGRGGARGTGPRTYGGTELTELGQKQADSFTRDENPRFNCETTSILFDWTFDGPVNRITQSKDTIVLQYGQFGLKRTIYMNLKQHPSNIKASRAGHSIGRWEGDVLVVDTVGFQPGVLSAPVRHSDKLHVVERFTLDPKTMALTRTYTAQDPVYLKGTYSGTDTIQVADAPYAPGKCEELGFIDYSKEGQRGR
ncbi:MAG TPA: DUF6152 family protein [Terriglobia bacterium]|nr:DUF6152 family protein [Terriglobia bacterium]